MLERLSKKSLLGGTHLFPKISYASSNRGESLEIRPGHDVRRWRYRELNLPA